MFQIRDILVRIRIRIPGSEPLTNLSRYGSESVPLTNWSGSGYGSRKTYGSCGSGIGSGTLPLQNQSNQSYTINHKKEFYAKTLLYSVRTRNIYLELVGLTWSVCQKRVLSPWYLSLWHPISLMDSPSIFFTVFPTKLMLFFSSSHFCLLNYR